MAHSLLTFAKMTSAYDIFKQRANTTQRRRPTHPEHDIQVACVRWFRLQYPHLAHALFAVPNGGRRDERTGAMLKAEGALPGVSDLILLHPSEEFCALLIEMKTAIGSQSKAQQSWQQLITASGRYRYIVCRSVDDFIEEIKKYMNP